MSERAAPQAAWAAGFLVAGCVALAGALASLGAGAKDLAWFGFGSAAICGVGIGVARPRYRRDGGLANPVPRAILRGGTLVAAGLVAVLFVTLAGERLGLRRVEPGTPPDQPGPVASAIIAFRHQADRHGVLVVCADRDSRRILSWGSGIVVQRVGRSCFVLTARHVVEGHLGSDLPVVKCYADWSGGIEELSGTIGSAPADFSWAPLLYADAQQDWALLVLHDPEGRAAPPEACRSGAGPGDWILAMGSPGTGAAFHDDGHIRGYREKDGVRYLLHDAILDTGSSGGPLFGHDFALIGINIASYSERPGAPTLGVALPAHDILKTLRFGSARIHASSEWADLQVDVEAGDEVALVARGAWRLGGFGGGDRDCDGGGLRAHEDRAFAPTLPTGALILGVRLAGGSAALVETTSFAPGGASGLRTVRGTVPGAGRLLVRCNDARPDRNSGSLEAALVVRRRSGPPK